MQVLTVRRYFMLKALAAEARWDDAVAMVWRYKQQHAPSPELPATFPYRAELVLAGYYAKDDIIGADTDELRRVARLPYSGAVVVLVQAPLIV